MRTLPTFGVVMNVADVHTPHARPSLRVPILWRFVFGDIQAASPLGLGWLEPATVQALLLCFIAAGPRTCSVARPTAGDDELLGRVQGQLELLVEPPDLGQELDSELVADLLDQARRRQSREEPVDVRSVDFLGDAAQLHSWFCAGARQVERDHDPWTSLRLAIIALN